MMNDFSLSLIEKIAQKVGGYFKFPGYDKDDVMQEARIIGMAMLPKYTEDRGDLENFLYVAISNRLRNLVKKHYYDYDRDNGGVNSAKKLINRPATDLDEYHAQNTFNQMAGDEIVDKVTIYLHPEYRKDFKRILEGHSVKTVRRAKIIEEAKRIYFLLMTDQERVLRGDE